MAQPLDIRVSIAFGHVLLVVTDKGVLDSIVVDIPALRRIVGKIPLAEDKSAAGRLVFEVSGRGFAWSFNERVAPRKPRRPRLDILAVRCALEEKEMLIDVAPERFFDDDHYRGYPAVLVRLEAIGEDELRGLLQEACRLTAAELAAKRRKRPSRR